MDDAVAVAHKIGADGADGTQRLQPPRRVLGQERACAQRNFFRWHKPFPSFRYSSHPFFVNVANAMIRQTTVSAPSQMNAKVGYTTISPAMRDGLGGKRHQIVEHEGGNVEIGEGQIAVQRAVAEKRSTAESTKKKVNRPTKRRTPCCGNTVDAVNVIVSRNSTDAVLAVQHAQKHPAQKVEFHHRAVGNEQAKAFRCSASGCAAWS